MAAQTEDDLRCTLVEDDCMDVLCIVGYRGVPQREKLENQIKIARLVMSPMRFYYQLKRIEIIFFA